jgi:DNA-binding response OmpR family regulator
LTQKEFDLLQTFLQHKGRVLTRQFLLENVWGYDKAVEVLSKTVDVTVGHLRQKLGDTGKRIIAVQGYGYRFELGQ